MLPIKRINFEIIDSTNSWARRHLAQLDSHQLTLLIAKEQSTGRGRFNHRWHSPACENLYATFCFFNPFALQPCEEAISLMAAVSVATALQEMPAIEIAPRLKWPNDLIIKKEDGVRKKMGGLLCERIAQQEGSWLLVGIGMNVNMPQEELQKIATLATSLMVENGKKICLESIVQALCNHFQRDLALFLREGFSPFWERYQLLHAYCPGDKISFHSGNCLWQGFFHSIDRKGSLSLQLKSGEVKTFFSGEVI